ncbi:MAG: hypothetical protein AAGA62_06915 [Bacteroidota bacterium]
MKKFIALYHNHATTSQEAPSLTEEEKNAMMAPWGAWQAKYGDRVVDMGAPLLPASKSSDGTDWSDATATVSGFSIVSADSLAAAQEMFVGHPIYNYPGHSVEICVFAPM